MIEFNTQISKQNYKIQFETDDKDAYLLIQTAIQRLIDESHNSKKLER